MTIYSTKAMPYVYLCVHKKTGQFYIGYRCANVHHNRPSHIDFPKYKSSYPNIKHNFNEYDWTILAEFFESGSAYDHEQLLIYNEWDNPLLLNESCFHLKKRFKSKPLTKKHKNAISIAQSKPKTETHKQALSAANIGKHWYNNGVISIQSKICPYRFVPGNLNKIKFDSITGSQAGKKNKGNKQQLTTCPHCNTTGGVSTMKQHHFEKCTQIQLHKLIHIITDEHIEISKVEFKKLYRAPLYHLLNGHVKSLKGWKLNLS
jgi:hypothetical protein